jgi:hypothetical protein
LSASEIKLASQLFLDFTQTLIDCKRGLYSVSIVIRVGAGASRDRRSARCLHVIIFAKENVIGPLDSISESLHVDRQTLSRMRPQVDRRSFLSAMR